MVDPSARLEVFTNSVAAIVGFALLVVPLFLHFQNQKRPGFTFLCRQFLLGISAIGMIVLAMVLLTTLIPEFWSDTDRFDSKQRNSAH